jgi:hypothetical protein
MVTALEPGPPHVFGTSSWTLGLREEEDIYIVMGPTAKHSINWFCHPILKLPLGDRISRRIFSPFGQHWNLPLMILTRAIYSLLSCHRTPTILMSCNRTAQLIPRMTLTLPAGNIVILFKAVFATKPFGWNSTNGMWRPGNIGDHQHATLMPNILQIGCRSAISQSFWYKGKEIYTRPSRKPHFSREFLETAAKILQEDEHAPSTKSSFNSKVKSFFTFANEVGITDLPPDGHELVMFATWLTVSGHCTTVGSLRQYLSAVRVLCRQKALVCPSPTEYGPLQATVSGMASRFAAPIRRSLPVTCEILINLVNSKPPKNATWGEKTILRVLKDTAILLFFTMLRGSNLFPPYPAAACKLRQLTWDKVAGIKGGSGVVLTLILEKTIRYRERLHHIALAALPGSVFCPVAALQRMADLRGSMSTAESDICLQLPMKSGGWRPLVKYEFNSWFRARISQMGLDETRYFVHGFRHGSLALALLHEPNVTLVRLNSNHLSDAIFTYSNIDPVKRFQVTQKMLSVVQSTARST